MITKTVLLTGVVSDSHTWGLAYLTLWLEDRDFRVINLGSCVPAAEVASAALERKPDLIMVSSVNGHGAEEGLQLIATLQQAQALRAIPAVIGGRLTTSLSTELTEKRRLLDAGFAGVFVGENSLQEFCIYLSGAGLLLQEAEFAVAA